MTSMIKTSKVTKVVSTSEGELQILSPISFEVKAGESIAIIGASGSGKSTLLGLLAGLDESTNGEIWLNGAPLHTMGEEERAVFRGQHVGFIFQSFMLVQSLTALENVMLPAEIAGLSNAKQRAMDKACSRVLQTFLQNFCRSDRVFTPEECENELDKIASK